MPNQNMPIYDFGPFRLDSAERVLLCNGEHVPLQPKAFETLLALVERHGRIVEKEDLMKRVWPDTFVEEVNLAKNISELRRIFRSVDPTQEFIATIPRRGYRFVASLKVREEQAEAPAPERAIAATKVETVNGAASSDWPIYLQEQRQEPAPQPENLPTAVPPETAAGTADRATTQSAFARHKTIALVSLAIGLALIAALAYSVYRLAVSEPLAARFQNLKVTRLTTTGQVREATISPDGKYVAYVNNDGGQASLWLRQVATGQEMQLVPTMTDGGFTNLSFSPDSNYVYYTIGAIQFVSTLHRIATLGGAPRKLTSSVVNSPVSFSPDGRRIVFTRGLTSNASSELVIANADGSNEQPLATLKTPERFVAPAWSPDGKVIACPVYKTVNNISLLAIAVDGGKQTVINSERWDRIERPSWLPDGSAVVVTAGKAGERTQIWLIAYPTGEARQLTHDLDGYRGSSLSADGRSLVALHTDTQANIWLAPGDKLDEAKQLTSGTGKTDGHAGLSWTPDQRILYTSRINAATTFWTMDASGGNRTQLPLPDEMLTNSTPKMTPEGKYVLFTSVNKGVSGIWRMDADGGNLRQLITLQNAPLLFDCSPDGQWIVFVNTVPGQGWRLWKMSIDGGAPVRLTDLLSNWPSISPDGKQIALSYADRGAEPRTMNFGLLPFDGGPVTKIIEMPRTAIFPNYQFKWTPDGQALAFLDRREGVNNIWLLPISGGEPRPLTQFKADGVYAFAWSRDGQWLALSRGHQMTDAVLISESK
jgi:Tol biopolymer transport system component/DNA-binding winged helix-turn-helix (wHTH) protein